MGILDLQHLVLRVQWTDLEKFFSRSITAEFIYWIVDRHSGLPNVLSISMARCVLAQRIPTVGIWRYVVDVPGSVNRSGGQVALYKTGSLHSYWAADVWHLPAYVCVCVNELSQIWNSHGGNFCLWKGSPLFLGTAFSDHQCEVAQPFMLPSISTIIILSGEGCLLL